MFLVVLSLLLTHAQSTLVAETVHEHDRIASINKNFKSTTETFVSSRSNIIIVQLFNIICSSIILLTNHRFFSFFFCFQVELLFGTRKTTRLQLETWQRRSTSSCHSYGTYLKTTQCRERNLRSRFFHAISSYWNAWRRREIQLETYCWSTSFKTSQKFNGTHRQSNGSASRRFIIFFFSTLTQLLLLLARTNFHSFLCFFFY